MGIGFETTAPTTAFAIKQAKFNGINNFYVLSLHKKIKPAMVELINDREINVHGFICPGHVAMVVGVKEFDFLAKYKMPGVITGFQSIDILRSIEEITKMIENNEVGVKNQYYRAVRKDGNKDAIRIMDEVFEVKKDMWRGIGVIEGSGLKIRSEYSSYNIESLYPMEEKEEIRNQCKCGSVIKGLIKPTECEFFGKLCSPAFPIGPCMVSAEGSCSSFYKYNT